MSTSVQKTPPETRQSLLLNQSPSKSSVDQSQIFKVAPSSPLLKNNKIYPEIESINKIEAGQPNIDQSRENLHEVPKKRLTGDDWSKQPRDEYQEGYQRKRKEGVKTFLKNGVQSAMQLPGETLKFLMNGGAKKNQMFIKQMKEKQQTSQARLSDENFKKNNQILYLAYYIGFYIQYVIMPFVILFGTVLCIVSLFLWNLYSQGDLDPDTYTGLQYLDFIIGCSIGTEWLINMYVSTDNVIVSFLDPENLIDGVLVYSMFWRFFDQPWYSGFALLNIFRAMRILKLSFLLKVAVTNFKKFVLKIKQNDLNAQEGLDFDDEGQLNRFIMDSLIKLLSGILIESTYFLTFDELVDYKGFMPFINNGKRMNYIQAIYYTIVSFSTIGYGDIYPAVWKTRLPAAVVLLINITVMSNFLGKFIEFLFQLSPYDRDYDFSDHVVIIGKVEEELLKDFLDELVENDKVQNRLLYLNEFKTGIKTIIVIDDEPNDTLRYLSIYYTEQYGNEVSFLKEGIFTAGKKWYHQANLKEAKILFAFSWFDENGNALENDKLISLAVTGVRDTYPDLRIMLVLNTAFKDQLDKDSLYAGIQSISPYQLNQQIMASSLENPGLGTILQHLLTMKAKNISEELLKASQHDSFMLSYIADMQQEIYSLTIPDFFIGMSFKDCAVMLYLYGLEFSMNEVMQGKFIQDHISDDRKMTLIAVETSTIRSLSEDLSEDPGQQESPNPTQEKQQLSIFRGHEEEENALIIRKLQERKRTMSIGHTPVSFFQQEVPLTKPTTQILINPQNYLLRKGDIIYVICDDYNVAMEAKDINSRESEKYIQYATNILSMAKNMEQKIKKDEIIEDLFVRMDKRYSDFDQEACNALRRDVTEVDPKLHHELNKYEDGVVDESKFSDAFDFFEQQYPKIPLKNHFLIFGNLDGFANTLWILRKYSDRPAVLYTEEGIDANKWNDITDQHRNVFFIKGDFLNQDDLARLQIKEAHQILIMSGLQGGGFADATGICIARILMDHYDRNAFIIQLNDESKISFLNKNPRLKNIECPNFFYPSFASGTVHFSSMTTAILARIVYSPNWLRFFEDLTIPKKTVGRIVQNKTVHCLRITKESAQTFRFFGQLQYALLEHKPSIVAIGMVKHTFGSQFHEELIETFLTDEFLTELIQMFQDIDLVDKQEQADDEFGQIQKQRSYHGIRTEVQAILQKILGDRFILTNPSFYTVLEENDEVLILGDLLKQRLMSTQQTQKPTTAVGKLQDTFELDLDKLLKDVVMVTPPSTKHNATTQNNKGTTTSATERNLSQLKSISRGTPQKRINMKSTLIAEIQRKYQGSNSFYKQFSELL